MPERPRPGANTAVASLAAAAAAAAPSHRTPSPLKSHAAPALPLPVRARDNSPLQAPPIAPFRRAAAPGLPSHAAGPSGYHRGAPTVGAYGAADGISGQAEVIEGMRQKFDELNMLRTTAAERALEDYKRAAERRIQAAEALIEALRQENEVLSKRSSEEERLHHLLPHAGRLSDVSSTSTARGGGGAFGGRAEDDGPLQAVVDLYQSLSGLQVSPDDERPSSLWHCSIGGRQGAFTFDLCLDAPARQYAYKPTFPPHAPIVARLPGYLQEEISFDCDQLQLFFWRALNFLMSQ